MKKLYLFYNPVINVLQFVVVFLLFSTLNVSAQTNDTANKTLSPCFEVSDSLFDLEKLPLKSTTVEVVISGVIANVTVKQTYINTGVIPIEANYVFPASTNAAVHGMQMQFGNRLLVAKIEEKEKANELYEEAKEEGKTVSLLEQHRPNVFQMHVANILPNDTIDIILEYTELLVPRDGVYEFVYPTVVGPRYTGGATEEWSNSPQLPEDELPLSAFYINVQINAGMVLREVVSPSHSSTDIQLMYNTANCTLPEEDKFSGNKDYILQYKLVGEGIESGLLLYEGEQENFFLAMIQPPERPEDTDIPPREYVFIMDVSGSMGGYPIETSKVLMNNLLSSLRAQDRFNVLFFAGGSAVLFESSREASNDNIQAAINMIDNQQGGGGTNMLDALQRAMDMPGTEGYSRSFIIATDGYVSFDREVIVFLEENLNMANFFPFGIGSSVNRYVIEGMAHVGQSEPFIVTNAADAESMALKFEEYIRTPVLTNIDVVYDDFTTSDVIPVEVSDVFAERPIILFGKYQGEATGTVGISGTTGDRNYYQEFDLAEHKALESNEGLKYLWARKKIQILDDYVQYSNSNEVEELKQEVIDLSFEYNLLTQYTSFIAIDSLIRCDTCSLVGVNQPLPLPEGVGDGSSEGGFSTVSISEYTYNFDKGNTAIQGVFPNPVSSQSIVRINIDAIDYAAAREMKIYDCLGKLVATIDLTDANIGYNELQLDIEAYNLSSGVYYLYLIVNKNLVDKFPIVYSKW